MQSSFTYGSLKRLGLFDPSTCVGLRYGRHLDSIRGFSWELRLTQLRIDLRRSTSSPLGVMSSRFHPGRTAYGFEPPSIRWLGYLPPSPLISTSGHRCRNINLLAITYAYRPRLRVRLTPGGLTWPGKPGTYGDRDFHPVYRYSLRHKLLLSLQWSFRSTFADFNNTPLPLTRTGVPMNPKLRCLA